MYKAFVIYFLLLLPCVSEATMVDLGEVIVSPKTIIRWTDIIGLKGGRKAFSLSYRRGWTCIDPNSTTLYMQPLMPAIHSRPGYSVGIRVLLLPNGLLLDVMHKELEYSHLMRILAIGQEFHCGRPMIFSTTPAAFIAINLPENFSDLKPGPFTYKVADIGPSQSPGKLPLDQVDTLQVTGNLIVTPCTLNTETMNVGFDEVLSISLPSTQKDIGMEVACLNGQSFYKASFTTTKSEGNVIIPTEGSARGIGIELVHSGVPIALNTPLQLTPGNANISARVVRQSGPIMSGDFTAVAELTFSYQ